MNYEIRLKYSRFGKFLMVCGILALPFTLGTALAFLILVTLYYTKVTRAPECEESGDRPHGFHHGDGEEAGDPGDLDYGKQVEMDEYQRRLERWR